MKKIIEWELLTADEIEVRAATTKNGKTTLLLYQDGRCTMRALDRMFGTMGWEISYKDVGGQIFGTLRCFDEESSSWIEKEDTGDKSNISEDKGQSSDILKRCAVRFGFARELYTAPRIIVDDDGYGNSGYRVSEIEYDFARNISHLKIVNKFGKEVFNWYKSQGDTSYLSLITPKAQQSQQPQQNNTQPQPQQEQVQGDKQQILTAFCAQKQKQGERRDELGKFYNYYMVKSFKGDFQVEKLWNMWKDRGLKKAS